MPPKLEELEKEIGRRLREFREGLCVPQTRFAKKAGIDRQRLVALESGRGRLKWGEVFGLAGAWEVNPGWLRTGQGERKTHFDFNAFPDKYNGGDAFSRVDIPTFSVPSPEIGKEGAHALKRGEDRWKRLAEEFKKMSDRERLEVVMTREFLESMDALEKSMRSAVKARAEAEGVMARRIAAAQKNFRESENVGLTPHGEPCETSDMPAAQLESLLARVARLSGKRGVKTELAKELGVPRQRVSEWLRGIHKPGAETAFALLNWADRQERK